MQIKKIESENDVYERMKLLGQGAFGKAYLVKEKSTGNLCVVKQMNIAEMSKAEQNETFKEAKILQALSHPNIVKFKDVYVTANSKLNIVMEYADGGDLSRKIKEQKASGKMFSETTLLDWFTQMCLAIKHVHDRKIIHRDIKGQNIFITKANTVKLGDFGIARVLNKTMDKARTVVGTPYYLSPEIIENKPYSYKSDIWSMGVVLYELCALAPPFNANSLQFLALKIVKGSYTPIQGSYSRELKTLIADMLNLDPNKRPSAGQILKLPFILNRIQKFLTETQNKVEFSHTVLHDFKLGFNKDKKQLVQNGANKQHVDSRQVEKQRLLLKEKQAQIQRLREQKKKQEQALEARRRHQQEQSRLRQLQAQDRKRDQLRKFQQKQEDLRENHARKEYQKYRLLQEQDKLNSERRKGQAERAKKEKEEQQKKYLEFAKQQFFRNKQIKENAERRANENALGTHQHVSEPQNDPTRPTSQPQPHSKPNFHYKNESDHVVQRKVQSRPSTGHQQRPTSRDKQKARQEQPVINDQDYMKAFMNPNFQKKQQQKQTTPPTKDKEKPEPRKVQPKRLEKTNDEDKRNDLKRRMEEGRMQMRIDKGEHKTTQETSTEHSQSPLLSVQKQSPTKNSEPLAATESLPKESKQDIKTIRGSKWSKQDQPAIGADVEQVQQLIQENKLLQKLIDDEIQKEEESENQLNEIMKQLLKVVGPQVIQIGNQTEEIQRLPSVVVMMSDNLREDDEKEPEKDSQFQEKPVYQGQGLKYFSDFAELENLRISLQDIFGTDKFVRAYKIIEREFQTHGVSSLQHDNLKSKVDFIDQNLFSQYETLLTTLIVMESKMNEAY